MKTPEGLTKGKDIFSGPVSHCRLWMDFLTKLHSGAAVLDNFSNYLERKCPVS